MLCTLATGALFLLDRENVISDRFDSCPGRSLAAHSAPFIVPDTLPDFRVRVMKRLGYNAHEPLPCRELAPVPLPIGPEVDRMISTTVVREVLLNGETIEEYRMIRAGRVPCCSGASQPDALFTWSFRPRRTTRRSLPPTYRTQQTGAKT